MNTTSVVLYLSICPVGSGYATRNLCSCCTKYVSKFRRSNPNHASEPSLKIHEINITKSVCIARKMHLLRLDGLKMRQNRSDGVCGGFTSSTVRDQQQKRGDSDGGEVFAKKSGKTSTSYSLTHSNKIYIYVVALAVVIFAFSSYVDM